MSAAKRPAPNSIRESQSGVIISWLAKLLLVLLIVGLAVYEMGAVIYANYDASEVASTAADRANFKYSTSKNSREAEAEAEAVVLEKSLTMTSFEVDRTSRTVSVTVEKKAATLFIHNIGPLRKYTTITATESKPFPG